MGVIVFIFLAFLFVIFPAFRCGMLHPVKVVRNGAVDLYLYFKLKQRHICKTGELIAYVGLFGKGKTLSAVRRVVSAYRKYNDKTVWCKRRKMFVTQKIKVLSNVNLKIPYERLESLEQVILCAERNQGYDDENGTLTVTLVLGDEFSVQMNSRNFKSNIDPLFLNTLLTCRHYHISLFYTAQRFGHVDALLRQVTNSVVDCNKLWRFQGHKIYDAWEIEHVTNPALLKPRAHRCWFVTNADYEAYDTLACVGNLKKAVAAGDMMSESEILALQCNQAASMEAVAKPSRQWLRIQRKRHG